MTRSFGERSWQVPNQMEPAHEAAREALDWVEAFPIAEQAKYSVRLALEEMLSHTIKDGDEDKNEHLITIHIAADSELVRIDLQDDGKPFDPTQHSAPDDLEDHLDAGVEGGFGIELVRCICRRGDYQREGDQNHVTLHIGILDPEEIGLPDDEERTSP